MNTRQGIQSGLKHVKKKWPRVDGASVPGDGHAASFHPLLRYSS